MSDFLKKLGTGVYAAVDELAFGLPDWLLKSISKDTYKKFKDYRRNEGRTAEMIGDIGSIVGDIALGFIPGVGAANAAAKAAKAGKAAGKLGKLGKAARGVVKVAKNIDRTVDSMGLPMRLGYGAVKGGAMALGDNILRTTFAADEQERDALKGARNMGLLTGAIGGALMPVLGKAKKLGAEGADAAKIAEGAHNKRAFLGLDHNERFKQTQAQNKYLKTADRITREADNVRYANTKLNIVDKFMPERGIDDFDEALRVVKRETGEKLGQFMDNAWESPQVQARFEKSKAGLEEFAKNIKFNKKTGNVNLNTISDPVIRDILEVYDIPTQNKVALFLKNNIKRLDNDPNPLRALKGIKEKSYKLLGTGNEAQAGLIGRQFGEILEDALEDSLDDYKKLSNKYRDIKTLQSGGVRTLQRDTRDTKTLGQRTLEAQTKSEGIKSFANAIVGNAAINAAVGAPIGFMSAGDSASLAEKLGTSALYAGLMGFTGPLLKTGLNAAERTALKGIEKNAGAIAKVLNNPKLQKNAGAIERAVRKAGTKSGNIIGKDLEEGKMKKAEELSRKLDKSKYSIIDNLANQYRGKLELFNEIYPIKIDDVEAQVAQYKNFLTQKVKDNPAAVIGKGPLSDLMNSEKIILSNEVAEADKIGVLKKLGLSEKKAERVLKSFEGKSVAGVKKALAPFIQDYIKTNLTPSMMSIFEDEPEAMA